MMKHLATILAASVAAGALVTSACGADGLAPVTVVEDEATFTLANGFVTARVSKRSGDLASLKYKDLELLGASGHVGGYWSHAASGPRSSASITIDPKNNDG